MAKFNAIVCHKSTGELSRYQEAKLSNNLIPQLEKCSPYVPTSLRSSLYFFNIPEKAAIN